MNFGEAIQAMKEFCCVSRKGWNGKNMHVYLEDSSVMVVKGGVCLGKERKYDPVFGMYTAQGTHQLGWVPSQADMLAEDWEVVDETN